jgi:predicted PurR-regulated permease PerM
MSPEEVHLEEREEEQKPASIPVPVLPAMRDMERAESTSATSNAIIAIFVVLAACYFAKIVFVVLMVAILLAFILAPIVDLLQSVRVPRPLGAMFAVCILGAAVYGVGAYGYSKAEDFVNDFPKYKEKIQGTIGRIQEKAEHIQRTAQDVIPQRAPQQQQPQQPEQQSKPARRGQPPQQTQPQQLQVQTVRVEQSSNWFDTLTAGAGSVTEVILAIGFIPFLVYFMLSWQEHVRANTVMLFEMKNRNTAYVTLGAISRMIRSFIVGNVLIGLFMSGVAMIVFGLLHLPYFYFIAFISGFLSLIPYLGVVLAIVPPLLAGIGQMHTSDAVIIVVTVISLHIFAMNVLYPKFVGSRVELNPLAVTVSLLVWGWLWGAMGLILAVPITAAMKIIFDHIESMRPYGAWLGE